MAVAGAYAAENSYQLAVNEVDLIEDVAIGYGYQNLPQYDPG